MGLDTADTFYDTTLDPVALQGFVQEMEQRGFRREGTHEWTGPTLASLRPFSDAYEMTIIVDEGWPYFPPGVRVEGTDSWHANLDSVCLWQAGDNTRGWVTLDGIYERIDEWVEDAHADFTRHGYALDPHLYYRSRSGLSALIDVDQHIGAQPSDGQTGNLKWTSLLRGILDIYPGPFRATDDLPHGIQNRNEVIGRWFFRDETIPPPKDIDQSKQALTENQADRFERDIRRVSTRVGLFILFWTVPGGIAPLMLLVVKSDGGLLSESLDPIPKGSEARLMRSGPDAAALRSQTVLIVGAGAIGSHAAQLLARSGVGKLVLVDQDRLWPANIIRHAVHADTEPGIPKVEVMARDIGQYGWTTVDTHIATVRNPLRMKELMVNVDLALDATGDGAFAEFMARVAAESDTPFVTVALYRGGALARVRRQAKDDRPIGMRLGHAYYPEITPAPDVIEHLGLETGCAAPVNNSPPIAVVRAAAMASDVCVDQLTGRYVYMDEVIDVYAGTDPPFDRMGIIRHEELPVVVRITESAQSAMRTASLEAGPNETGGVLIGVHVDGHPYITEAIRVDAQDPTPSRFIVEAGRTREVVEDAAATDSRLGYLGEWHNHPTDQGPSSTDRTTMRLLGLDDDTGTPILVVVRPTEGSAPRLDTYVTRAGQLVTVDTETVGGLPDLEDK